MSRISLGLAFVILAAAVSFSGCAAPCGSCGPMAVGPIGPGCFDTGCNDCDGASACNQYVAHGPLDALRNARRRMVCGTGCGEAYMGEWISTPPDAVDPCCGDQFVGGATKCQPFCWQPGGILFGLQGLYGKRMCSGNQSSTPCPCGNNFCDRGCGMATMVSNPVMNSHGVGSPVMTAPVTSGCSSCMAKSQAQQAATAVATNSRPAVDAATAKKVVAKRKSAIKQATPVVR